MTKRLLTLPIALAMIVSALLVVPVTAAPVQPVAQPASGDATIYCDPQRSYWYGAWGRRNVAYASSGVHFETLSADVQGLSAIFMESTGSTYVYISLWETADNGVANVGYRYGTDGKWYYYAYIVDGSGNVLYNDSSVEVAYGINTAHEYLGIVLTKAWPEDGYDEVKVTWGYHLRSVTKSIGPAWDNINDMDGAKIQAHVWNKGNQFIGAKNSYVTTPNMTYSSQYGSGTLYFSTTEWFAPGIQTIPSAMAMGWTGASASYIYDFDSNCIP